MKRKNISVILLAGGKGSRLSSALPKQYIPIGNKAVALYSFEVFLELEEIDEIIVVCAEEYRPLFQNQKKPISFALPGDRRQDSVYNGLQALSPQAELVCIHDSARPFIDKKLVKNVLEAGILYGAATVGTLVKNTIKESNEYAFVKNTPDRSKIWEIQTPQVMRVSLLKEGFAHVHKNQITVTDDVSIAELMKYPVKLVEGDYRNFKITTAEDLQIAEKFLS